MKGRTPTAAEQQWMDMARDVGCIACIIAGRIVPYTVPAEYTAIHHINGRTQAGAHFNTIPLCPADHQTGEFARHRNKAVFESTYATEAELLRATVRIVEARYGHIGFLPLNHRD